MIQRDEPIRAEWVASLDGLVNAQIRAQVSGYLLKQNYADGTQVKKGDTLFEIDPRSFQATLGQVQANYDRTESDRKRQAELGKENAVSAQDLDNATQNAAAAKAALDQAQLNIEFTKVTSPIDGLAGIATAQIGDLVGPSTGILTTVSTIDPIKVYFSISGADLSREFQRARTRWRAEVSRGADVRAHHGGWQRLSAAGKIPRGRPTDRRRHRHASASRASCPIPDPTLLRPGQYARDARRRCAPRRAPCSCRSARSRSCRAAFRW